MNARLTIGVTVACLVLAPASSAAIKLVNPSVVASRVAGKPITVSVNSFGPGTWTGAAVVGGDHVFLGEDAYRDAKRGGGVGLFVLLHETGHATGIADEHAADCFSLAHLKSVLLRFWQLRPAGIAQRYDDALAWPGKYDGNRCFATKAATK